jgi:excisionase family DNA binding protein
MKRITGVVLTDAEAHDLATAVMSAHQFIRTRHGAGLTPNVLVLAAKMTATGGNPDNPTTGTEHSVQHEQIDTATAATILGCSERNIRYLAGAGRLPGHRHGGRWMFHRDDVLVYRDYHQDDHRTA